LAQKPLDAQTDEVSIYLYCLAHNLTKHRSMIDAGGEGHHIVHGEGGTSEQRRQAQQELHEFVLNTHQRLVTLEKRRDALHFTLPHTYGWSPDGF
jgi:hypothetical protein